MSRTTFRSRVLGGKQSGEIDELRGGRSRAIEFAILMRVYTVTLKILLDAAFCDAEIYNWFTEGFDTADLKDAKALLDELEA
jgi:hypothetical protein